MKNERKYVVVKEEYFTDHGKIYNTKYRIRYKTTFLGLFSYWNYIRDGNGKYSSRIDWKTKESAEDFIKNVLCLGKPYASCKGTVVSEINCK
jgi:hypothetical protein